MKYEPGYIYAEPGQAEKVLGKKLDGDECSQDCEGWINADMDSPFSSVLTYRRKITAPRWIPVTERLPEKGKNVVVVIGNNVISDQYNGSQWDSEWYETGKPTHWMEIPPLPPKPDPILEAYKEWVSNEAGPATAMLDTFKAGYNAAKNGK